MGRDVNQQKLENMILTCIDTARAMLDEYNTVIPFGIRTFTDSDDMKMNCPAEKKPEAGWQEQIEAVVDELREFTREEDVESVILVSALASGEDNGIGLQVENSESAVLFVYPYRRENDQWIIDEPEQSDQLLVPVYGSLN